MCCLEHPVEKLRLALFSTRKDLIEACEQYSKEEKRFLEEGLLPGSPLFTAITIHSKSEWISAHPEAPQDFQSFYSNPYRSTPGPCHQTIYIQTIGSFGAGEGIAEQYVEWLKESFYCGLRVKLLPAVTISSTRCTFRVNSNTNNLQLHGGNLLAFLKKQKPKDAFCIVGITMIDLYPKDSWNFVFGQASLCEGMGVFSFARYDDDFYTSNYAGTLKRTVKLKPGDYSVFQDCYIPPISSTLLLRSCKTLTHEIGHIFGIKHCQWLQCVMQGSNHLQESDNRPLDLCPICLRKLQCAIGFKIKDRYTALLRWIEKERSDHQSEKPKEAFQDFRKWLCKCLSILEEERV